jgi:small subunit ribosomal protein S3
LGQKIHPKGFRLGVIQGWDSRWYAEKEDFADLLHEDWEIRQHIKDEMYNAGISRIEIERPAQAKVRLTVHTAKPGMVIGRGGSGVERLRVQLEKLTERQISINVVEVDNPNLDAQLAAESVAQQLVRRVSFRRAMRQTVSRGMRAGAEGVKVMIAGRLGGAEMSRTEWVSEGSVPLHTLRADIDYGFAEAQTTYGTIGVKVWIYKGEILPEVSEEGG